MKGTIIFSLENKILKKISKKTMIIAISHQKELTTIADEVFTFSSNGRVIKK